MVLGGCVMALGGGVGRRSMSASALTPAVFLLLRPGSYPRGNSPLRVWCFWFWFTPCSLACPCMLTITTSSSSSSPSTSPSSTSSSSPAPSPPPTNVVSLLSSDLSTLCRLHCSSSPVCLRGVTPPSPLPLSAGSPYICSSSSSPLPSFSHLVVSKRVSSSSNARPFVCSLKD